MAATPPPKKSETIEVRLSFEAKQDFLARCKAEGQTASEAVRSMIQGYPPVEPAPVQAPAPAARGALSGLMPGSISALFGKKRWLAFGAGALGLAALVALPNAAAAAQNSIPSSGAERAAAFARLDRNGDGVVTYEEFVAR